MNQRIFGLLLLTILLTAPARAHAQYLFLDSNGDGAFTSADRLNAAGSTTLSVWLRTDQNKDGSKAVCARDPAQELSIFSYEFILHTSGGTVVWGSYTNLLAGM